jgi:hypothetical protein
VRERQFGREAAESMRICFVIRNSFVEVFEAMAFGKTPEQVKAEGTPSWRTG